MKIYRIALVLIAIFTSLSLVPLHGQGFEIRISDSHGKYDSLHIQSFNSDNKFVNQFSVKYEPKMVFKSKKSLSPGLYLLTGDTTAITDFIISDNKNQKFLITVLDSTITFTGSIENEANKAYVKQMYVFENQLRALDQEFAEMKNGGLPQYMMQVFVDSLISRANVINANKQAYQLQMVDSIKGRYFLRLFNLRLNFRRHFKNILETDCYTKGILPNIILIIILGLTIDYWQLLLRLISLPLLLI